MNKQRGESRVGCVLYILIILYIIIIGFQLVPVMYNNLQLKDQMKQVAASYNQFHGRTVEMKKIMTQKAHEMDLPVDMNDFKIIKRGKNVEISATYMVEINFLFMKKKVKMNPEVSKIVYNF